MGPSLLALAKSIYCRVFYHEMRKPNQVSICDIVNSLIVKTLFLFITCTVNIYAVKPFSKEAQ